MKRPVASLAIGVLGWALWHTLELGGRFALWRERRVRR